MINLYSKVVLRLVLKIVVMVVGFGCGGRKQWVIESVVIIGMLIYNRGNFDDVMMVNINGNSRIKFILKNMVRFIIRLVIISVYCMCFLLKVVISVVVICCVVFVLEISLFNMVLKLRIIVSLLSVLLILFCIECRMVCVFIFLVNLMMVVIRMRVIKLLILKMIIRIRSSVMFVVIMINGIVFIFYQCQKSSVFVLYVGGVVKQLLICCY